MLNAINANNNLETPTLSTWTTPDYCQSSSELTMVCGVKHLELDGEGYFILNATNVNNNLKTLTLSTWIIPDYYQSSSELTIVSIEKSFVLSINNSIPPEKIAKFSVYDGIRWVSVESTSTIEGLTHLAATFDGEFITIYVNGNQESIVKLKGTHIYNTRGELVPTLFDKSMDNDIVIGAYNDNNRDEFIYHDFFTGFIPDLQIWDESMTSTQIKELNDNFWIEDNR